MSQDKHTLRQHFATLRQSLPLEVRAEKTQVIARHTLVWLLDQETPVIGGYAALPDRGELDIWQLLAELYCQGFIIALPAVTAGSRLLAFRQYKPGEPLEKDRFGIPAPTAAAPELTPHLLLVPLLAVDKNGYRLGYGGGYYDATIAAFKKENPELLAVGLGFSAQLSTESLPREPHDQPLDAVITEEGVKYFDD